MFVAAGASADEIVCLNPIRLLLSIRAIFLGGLPSVRSIIFRLTPKTFTTRIFAASFSLFCSLGPSLEEADDFEKYDAMLMSNIPKHLIAETVDVCSRITLVFETRFVASAGHNFFFEE
jgi:hypothetical protein